MELLYLSSWTKSHEIEYRQPFHNSHKNNIKAQNFLSFAVFFVFIRHELGLDIPVSLERSSQVFFVHVVYNSA